MNCIIVRRLRKNATYIHHIQDCYVYGPDIELGKLCLASEIHLWTALRYLCNLGETLFVRKTKFVSGSTELSNAYLYLTSLNATPKLLKLDIHSSFTHSMATFTPSVTCSMFSGNMQIIFCFLLIGKVNFWIECLFSAIFLIPQVEVPEIRSADQHSFRDNQL